jgi:transcriptional regulator with XRE-family HTH domain
MSGASTRTRDRLADHVQQYPTQADFARRVGISQAYLSQLLNGVRGMRWETAKRVHRETGIPIADLMEIASDRVA